MDQDKEDYDIRAKYFTEDYRVFYSDFEIEIEEMTDEDLAANRKSDHEEDSHNHQ